MPFVSLPNLIAGRRIVDEQLLHLCTPDAVAARLRDVLPGAAGYDAQQQGYADMRAALGSADAAETAARDILADLRHQ